MRQKIRPYWFLSVLVLLLLVLAACVRPVPGAQDPTPVPEVVPTVAMPTAEASTPTPLPDPAYPGDNTTEETESPDSNTEDSDVALGDATAVPPPAQNAHTVVEGETLSGVAQQYGVTVEALAVANNITTSSELTPGQALVIPTTDTTAPPPDTTAPPTTGEQVHIVQPGENLFRISLRYGKSVDEVAAYNGIANPHYIYPGQAIRIP